MYFVVSWVGLRSVAITFIGNTPLLINLNEEPVLWIAVRPKFILLTVPMHCFFCGSFVFFLSCVCYAFVRSVYLCLVVTYWESDDHLALVCGV